MQGKRLLVFVGIWFLGFSLLAAGPVLTIQQAANNRLQVTWPSSGAGFVLEQADELNARVAWQTVSEAVANFEEGFSVTIQPGSQPRFYRLRQESLVASRVVDSSPALGESGVAVTRETIFRLSGPLAPETTVTTSQLFAEYGGRRLLGRAEIARDRRTVTLFYLENLPASARVRVSFLGDGLKDANGVDLDADGDGSPGGIGLVSFDTATTTALESTAVIGHVFASEFGPGGTNRPLAGVTVTVDGAEESLRTTTDAAGAFKLQPAPAGRFFVHVDGRTAAGSQWPNGAYYPFVGKAWEAVAGKADNLAGGSGEIFLPLIQSDALKPVSATAETRVTFAPSLLAAHPTLAGVEILVPANALFSDNGTRGGKVGLAPVPADRLPEPLPPGLNLPLVITVQTDGGSNFDVPVPVKFPNLPDPVTGLKLGPGATTVLWSFNHDTGRWEPQGTATISADGLFAVSDPGTGIRQPGWHGVAAGTRASGPGRCVSPDCVGPNCGGLPDHCCSGWDNLKLKCDRQRDLALNAITDLAVDGLDFAVEAFPAGCLLTSPLEVAKTARDCTAKGGNQFSQECADIATDNGIGFALSCIPVVGGILDLGWSGKQLIDNTFNYTGCLDTLTAQCFGKPPGRPAGEARGAWRAMAEAANYDSRMVQAMEELQLQYDMALASSNFLARFFGDTVWAKSSSPEEHDKYVDLFSAIQSALAEGGPGGSLANAAERTALLALPVPTGISPAQVTALIDRLQGFRTGALQANAALREELSSAYGEFLAATDKIVNRGWTDFFDGFRRAVTLISAMNRPDVEGGAVVQSGAMAALQAVEVPATSGGAAFPSGPHFYLLRDQDTGFLQRGRLNKGGRFEGIILRPDALYSVAYYDAQTRRMGGGFFQSALAGRETTIPTAALYSLTEIPEIASIQPDSDGDGLPDRVEGILGTSKFKEDSDGDGIKDGPEVNNGTNPLDGTPAASGLIAGADTPGRALDVYARGNNVFVADNTHGLAVFELNGANDPTLVAQLAVANNPHAIAGVDQVVALATEKGVTLVNVADPSAPVAIAALRLGAQANAVAARSGQVAAALNNGTLILLDALTGAEQQRLEGLDARLDDLQFSGGRLFVLSSRALIGFERVDSRWEEVGRLAVAGNPAPLENGRKLVVNGGIAWVGHFGGFSVINVNEPSAMTLLTGPTGRLAIHDAALTGSGSLAAATSFGGAESLAVSLYDARNPAAGTTFQVSFQTVGTERALTVHRGLILVAAGDAGLQLVNFLPPDLGTTPPIVSLTPDYPGVLPRADFGGLLPVTINATDDVGIRLIELEVDGLVSHEAGGLPFRLGLRLPAKSSGKTGVTLRARATDLAGNSTWTAPLTVPLVDDAVPPGVLGIEPLTASKIVPAVVNEVRVMFNEPIAVPVTSATLTLLWSGPDEILGTADDAPQTGLVTYDSANRAVLLTTSSPMMAGKYVATLAAGIADAAGNIRAKPLVWQFQTGNPPQIIDLFPPENLVRAGGTLDELVFQYDQPVPRTLAETYTWKILFRPLRETGGVVAPLTQVSPLQVERSGDGKALTFRTAGSFRSGFYSVTGTGPNMRDVFWDFTFRDVPNEWIPSEGGLGTWKYSPGPVPGDSLVVNAPGTVAVIEQGTLRSIIAQTDVRFGGPFGTQFTVEEPIQLFAGLELFGSRFKQGTTHVRGPLLVSSSTEFNPIDIGAHTLNAYGGGSIKTALHFSDPNGALVNHAGSSLVLSNGTMVANTGIVSSNAGRIVNLGTLRSVGPDVRLEDVRLRNDGRIEVAAGNLKIVNFENEEVVDVAPGAKVVFAQRLRGGISSRITGAGAVEFGEYNSSTRRVVSSAQVELRGDLETTGPLTLVAGTVTLWRPLVRPLLPLVVQNGGVLRLLAPSHLGAVALEFGDLVLNSDTEIDSVTVPDGRSIEVATRARVNGEARLAQVSFSGPGTTEFAGWTVVSNGTQTAAVGIRDGAVRNTGRWSQAAGGTQGSSIVPSANSLTGVFENAGEFEQSTARLLVIQTPFRNSGRAVLSSGTVSFDAQPGFNPAHRGAYVPQPGGELILNGTPLEHNYGVLDLGAGVVRGTGSIRAVGTNPRPKVINRAVLRPGNPTGDLSIRATDGFEQTASGELVITLASAGHGALRLTSTTAALAGKLTVELAAGFSPALGQVFEVITSSGLTGVFGEVVLPDLAPGLRLAVSYSTTSVSLTVTQ